MLVNKIVYTFLSLLVANSIAMNTPENLQAKKLCEAIQFGRMQEFNALLGEGIDHTIPYCYVVEGTHMVRTPIMVAIMSYQLGMGKRLLDKNPEKQINGHEGGTLMEFAAMRGSIEFIPLLLSHGAEIDERVFQAAWLTDRCSEQRKIAFLQEIRRIHALRKV